MWIPGVVIQVRGPVPYTIELANGEQKRRYVEHLHVYVRKKMEIAKESAPDWADVIPSEAAAPQPSVDEPGGNESVHALPTLRRSSRIQQAPERFGQ